MVHITPASPAEQAAWRADWQARVERWYGDLGVADIAARRLTAWDDASDRELAIITDESVRIGQVAVAHHEGPPMTGCAIHDVWIDPAHRGRGHGRAARRHVEEWARSRAGLIGVNLWTDDPGARALFASYPLRNQRMVKPLTHAPDLPAAVTVRPIEPAEYAEWLATEIEGYAADMSNSGSRSPEEARAASEAEYAQLLPDGPATAMQSIWMVDVSDENVAAIWLSHARPGLAFVFSVEVRPEHRGKGYGRAAMLAGEQKALANGDALIALNVFGHNTVAMRLYDSLGYAVIEQTRTT